MGGKKMIEDYAERHYPFEGCFNFRDIGGYKNKEGRRVKKGLYFRTGRQDRMTQKDLIQLKDLKIKTQIDLRKSEEILDCIYGNWKNFSDMTGADSAGKECGNSII